MHLSFDASEIERATLQLEATQREAEAALRSTVRRSSRWLATRIRRELAGDLRVTQRVLRRRMIHGRVEIRNGRVSARIWFGINPIDLTHLAPRQNRRGVRTRVGLHPGAFMVRGRVFRRVGGSRFPLVALKHQIEAAAVGVIRPAAMSAQFSSQVLKTYERELLWRISRR